MAHGNPERPELPRTDKMSYRRSATSEGWKVPESQVSVQIFAMWVVGSDKP
jgi:hypothetical protein